jgi:hypothetical protein
MLLCLQGTMLVSLLQPAPETFDLFDDVWCVQPWPGLGSLLPSTLPLCTTNRQSCFGLASLSLMNWAF